MARTVANGLITQTLIDAQSGGRKPYIRIYINGTDYSDRVLYLEHHEEAYRDRATIGLSNRDSSLDGLDLNGKEFEIGYGFQTSLPTHPNIFPYTFPIIFTASTGNEYVRTAPLWVKSCQVISVQGERIYQIYAEGSWMRLREQRVLAGVTGEQNVIYSNIFPGTYTVYGLIDLIIEGAMSWDLEDNPPDDGIIDTFTPVFQINEMPFENAAALLYRLIWMTLCYYRIRPVGGDSTQYPSFQIVYPQATDAVDGVYYSDQVPYFTEYVEKTTLLIPNSIVVLCNQDSDTLEWDTEDYPLIVGTAKDQDQIDKYTTAGNEVVQVFLCGNIRNPIDADNRARAILTRLQSEILSGRLLVPHDAQRELLDKVLVEDNRGA